jgi:DNA/RNA endonuclease YhcR with UshA esterase domain
MKLTQRPELQQDRDGPRRGHKRIFIVDSDGYVQVKYFRKKKRLTEARAMYKQDMVRCAETLSSHDSIRVKREAE